jgi:hypothetical protein
MTDQGNTSTGGGTTSTTGRAEGAPGGWTSVSTGQWPAQVADTIEGVVTTFRTQVIRPLMLVARGLVFGIIVGTMAIVIGVLLAVSLVRFMTVYFFGGRVWISYLVLGSVFVILGFVAWALRHSPGEDSAEAA